MRLSLSLSAVLIIAGKRRPRAQRWVEICARLCLLGVAPCASFQRKPTWLMVDVLHLLQYYCTIATTLSLSRVSLSRVCRHSISSTERTTQNGPAPCTSVGTDAATGDGAARAEPEALTLTLDARRGSALERQHWRVNLKPRARTSPSSRCPFCDPVCWLTCSALPIVAKQDGRAVLCRKVEAGAERVHQ